jgi:hypothetical protein
MNGERDNASENPFEAPVPFPFGTPENRWVVVVFAILLWATMPVAAAIYFATEFGRNAYPAEGDAIVIPIVGVLGMSVVSFPVFGAFLWFAASRYSPEQSLLAWNCDRPVWSLCWTIAFLSLILYSVHWATGLIVAGHLIPAGHTLACIVLYAILRASIVTRRKELAAPMTTQHDKAKQWQFGLCVTCVVALVALGCKPEQPPFDHPLVVAPPVHSSEIPVQEGGEFYFCYHLSGGDGSTEQLLIVTTDEEDQILEWLGKSYSLIPASESSPGLPFRKRVYVIPSTTAEALDSLLKERGFYEWRSTNDNRGSDGWAWEVLVSNKSQTHRVVVSAGGTGRGPVLTALSNANYPDERQKIDTTYPEAHRLARDFFNLVDDVHLLAERDRELIPP